MDVFPRVWLAWEASSVVFGWGPSLHKEIVGTYSDSRKDYNVNYVVLSSQEDSEWYMEQRYGRFRNEMK